MTGPVTLGDFFRDSKLLWTYCRDCCRERYVDPATIQLPPEFPVPNVGSRMKCSACGSRAVFLRTALRITIVLYIVLGITGLLQRRDFFSSASKSRRYLPCQKDISTTCQGFERQAMSSWGHFRRASLVQR